LSNFFDEFDAEWLAISGELSNKGAKIYLALKGFDHFARYLRSHPCKDNQFVLRMNP
jgi:hypothetical protein